MWICFCTFKNEANYTLNDIFNAIILLDQFVDFGGNRVKSFVKQIIY